MNLEDLQKLQLHGELDSRTGGDGRAKARGIRLLIFLGLVLITCSAWYAWKKAAPVASARDAVMPSGATEDRGERPIATAAQASKVLTIAGYVVPRIKGELGAKIVGRVEYIGVDVGDLVRKGQVVARLECHDLQAQLEQAEADLAVTERKYEDLAAGSRGQEVRQSKAALEGKEADARAARLQFERISKLYIDGVVSAQQFEAARNDDAVRQAELRAATERLNLVEEGPRSQTVEVARAEIRQAAARVEYYRTQLKNAVIASQLDGIVTERMVQVGEVVAPGVGAAAGIRTSIVKIASLDDLRVEADINESDIGRLSLQQAAEIVIDGVANQVYQGRLIRIWPEANRQKGTVKVEVLILNADAQCRPESSARVSFLASKEK